MSLARIALFPDEARRVARLGLGVTLGLAVVCAADGSTAPREVSDAPAPHTPAGLWLASTSAPAVLQLTPSLLPSEGHVAPAAVVTATGIPLHSLVGMAFDSTGRMWIANQGDSTLLAFSPAELDAPSERKVDAVISATDRTLSAPVGIAFDARQRLWVANFGSGTLTAFDLAQLATSGTPTPETTIEGLDHPTALAFDAAGSLWVADMQAETIIAYDADQIATSGAPTPRITIRSASHSLSTPTALAFDADGTLWVANLGSGTVVGFAASQLTESGSPAPRVTLAPDQQGLIGSPAGLAFDGDGSLWVAGLQGIVSRFTRQQLAVSTTSGPSMSVTVDGHGLLWGTAFWPRPQGLPLN
jgi:sugar lactone lactonase YvrE